MNPVTERTTCRVCGSGLKSVLNLGEIAVSWFHEKNETPFKAPLELMRCLNARCDLVQLRHTVSSDILYRGKYWYKSATSPKIVKDLKEIAENVSGLFPKTDTKKRWIDVGANDGTLLSFVDREKFNRTGVEPALNFAGILDVHCEVVVRDLWENAFNDVLVDVKADVITAIGMFYDSEDPNKFISKAKNVLAKDGVFIAQLMTLAPMIRQNDIGNICHEHLEYYSYRALVHLFESNGLEIFKVEENDINGGSYRIWARHYVSGSVAYTEPEVDWEMFYAKISDNRKATLEFFAKQIHLGKMIFGYGASTKGNTILQWYGLNSNTIRGIADKDPTKRHRFTAGSNIEVVSEEHARRFADYFFVLPYSFLPTFIERENDWMKRGGEGFVVCTPHFKIVKT